jgi:hypothetical protein
MAEKITITIVVNGQPTHVVGDTEAPVGSLIPKALEQTGNQGQPPDNWELRNAEGQPVEVGRPVRDFAGQTLFLNLRAGIGG